MNTLIRFLAPVLLSVCTVCVASVQTVKSDKKQPETSRLARDKGFETVQKLCTSCHSSQLIVQNRASREGWLEAIRWMQRTQNLQTFDAQTETLILDYLAKNYAPNKKGRRVPLKIKRWYSFSK